MKIELGKLYETRDGHVASITSRQGDGDDAYPFRVCCEGFCDDFSVTAEGFFYEKDSGEDQVLHEMDLIKPFVSPSWKIDEKIGMPCKVTTDDKITITCKGTADDGTKRTFSTGYQRDTGEGKGRWDLMMQAYYGLLEVARLFARGAKTYGESNWLKGAPLSVYADCMSRHAAKLAAGWVDERHDSAVAWNALCYIHTLELIQQGKLPAELDDRPKVA